MVPLTGELRAMALGVLGVARSIAARHSRTAPRMRDECLSAAYLGVVRAAGTFSEGEGHDWGQWSSRIIEASVQDTFRSKHCQPFPLIEQEKLEKFADAKNSNSELGIDDLLDLLSGRERKFCEYVYVDGHSQAAASKIMGVSEATGARIHKSAIGRLQKRLGL